MAKSGEKIFSGQKKYEFRRRIFKEDVNKVYLYYNGDVGRIVGCFEIGDILEGSPSSIWRECGKKGGITRKKFFEYFNGSNTAFAIIVKKPHKFSRAINPKNTIPNFVAPQSFRYVERVWPKKINKIK